MNSFQEMGLNPIIDKSLETLNFTVPTPIQAQTIPLALAGRDILGSAQTGTGKTLAFTIPLVNRLLEAQSEMALVLVPTRELAQQVATAIKQVTNKHRGLRTALLIGGDSFFKQLQQLRSEARIIVGTPGRVIDHLKRGTVKPTQFKFLVLDETDRMFDMGFESQIDQIIQQLPQERQTLMFSATLPASIVKTASRYLIKPERIAIGDVSTPVAKIKQDVLFVSESEKEGKLIEELTQRHAADESILIFIKTKWNAEKLAGKLSALGHKAIALHGDLRQNKRERVVAAFRKGTYNILVATDIAARGLDIPQIRHIINYDLPQCPEDYIHRIGRTGRAGAEGFSLCLVTPKETKNWKIINKFANTSDGISDSDRAALSHRGSKGGRGGFSSGRDTSRGGERRGGGRREFFGSRDRDNRFSDRPRGERRPFKKDFDTDGGNNDTGFERRKPYFDRPFDKERSPRFDRSSESRPFFKKERTFGESSEEGGFKKRFDRPQRFSNSFSSDERPARRREDFAGPRDGAEGEAPRRRFFDKTSDRRGGFFKKDGDRPFSRSGNSEGGFKKDRPFRSFSDSGRSEGFRPKRDGDKPRFDRPFDGEKPAYKRKKRD